MHEKMQCTMTPSVSPPCPPGASAADDVPPVAAQYASMSTAAQDGTVQLIAAVTAAVCRSIAPPLPITIAPQVQDGLNALAASAGALHTLHSSHGVHVGHLLLLANSLAETGRAIGTHLSCCALSSAVQSCLFSRPGPECEARQQHIGAALYSIAQHSGYEAAQKHALMQCFACACTEEQWLQLQGGVLARDCLRRGCIEGRATRAHTLAEKDLVFATPHMQLH